MLKILKRMRKQTAVYWAYVGVDSNGRPKYASPVELSGTSAVRWEDSTVLFVNSKGAQQASRAVVYLDDAPTPAVPVAPLGVLLKARLADLDSSHRANPFLNAGAWQMQKLDEIPTLKADQFVRIAYL